MDSQSQPDLERWIINLDLSPTPVQEIIKKLAELGATKVSHLLDLDEEEVDLLELKRLEKKRWNNALIALKSDAIKAVTPFDAGEASATDSAESPAADDSNNMRELGPTGLVISAVDLSESISSTPSDIDEQAYFLVGAALEDSQLKSSDLAHNELPNAKSEVADTVKPPTPPSTIERGSVTAGSNLISPSSSDVAFQATNSSNANSEIVDHVKPPTPPSSTTDRAIEGGSVSAASSLVRPSPSDVALQAINSSKPADSWTVKLARIPDCAEKSLMELSHYFKVECLEKQGQLDKKYVLQKLKAVKAQVENEQISSKKLSVTLKALEDNVDNFSTSECADHLDECIKAIQHIDTDLLVELLTMHKNTALKIQGKDVILLLGVTGTGKSTTVHFLGGSKMKMTYDKKTGRDHLEILECAPGLEECVASSESASETTSINAVDLDFGQGKLVTVCDTPGFGDNRGVEIDISNGIGIINAVRGARSIRPLFLISSGQLADRSDGLVNTLQMAARMMSPLEEQIPTFNYWFTKFENPLRYKDNERVYTQVVDKYKSLCKLKKDDVHLLTVMNNMVEKIKGSNEHAVVLDPEQDDRNGLLGDLMSTPAIEAPDEVFTDFASGANLDKLKVQLGMHSTCISRMLELKDYPMIVYKLSQLKTLSESLLLEEPNRVYTDCVQMVFKEAEQRMSSVESWMDVCFSCSTKQLENNLQHIAESVCDLYKLEALRNHHFSSRLAEFPSFCKTVVLRAQKQLIEFDNTSDIEDVDSNMQRLNLMIAVFEKTFDAQVFDSTENTYASGLLKSQKILRKEAQSLLEALYNGYFATFSDLLQQSDILKCVYSINQMSKFTLSLNQYVARDVAKSYLSKLKESMTSLTELVSSLFKESMSLLDSKTLLSQYSENQIVLIQRAARVTHAAKKAYQEEHFKHCSSLFDHAFDQLIELLQDKISQSASNYSKCSDDENPFEKANMEICSVRQIRSESILHDNTSASYAELVDAIKDFVNKLYHEVMMETKLLVEKNWSLTCKSYVLKLSKLQGASVLKDFGIYTDQFENVDGELNGQLSKLLTRIEILDTKLEDKLDLFNLVQPAIISMELLVEFGSSTSDTFNGATMPTITTVKSIIDAFHNVLNEQLIKMGDIFPSMETMKKNELGFRITCEKSWEALCILNIASKFNFSTAATVTGDVRCFADSHSTLLQQQLQEMFVLIKNEVIDADDLDDTGFSAKKAEEVSAFEGLLKYIENTVGYYTKMITDECVDNTSSGFMIANANDLHSIVFVEHLNPLLEAWLGPNGKLTSHKKLLEKQFDAVEAADYDTLNIKRLIIHELSRLDAVLEDHTSFSPSTTFGSLETVLLEKMKLVNGTVSIDIKSGHYDKVAAFFNERNLKDPAVVSFLQPKFDELNSHVQDCLLDTRKKLSVDRPAIPVMYDIQTQIQGLECAAKHVLVYLEATLSETLKEQVDDFRMKLIQHITTHFHGAGGLIKSGSFVKAEHVFQQTSKLITSMFGSDEAYRNYMHEKGINSLVDVARKREKFVTGYLDQFHAEVETAVAATVECWKKHGNSQQLEDFVQGREIDEYAMLVPSPSSQSYASAAKDKQVSTMPVASKLQRATTDDSPLNSSTIFEDNIIQVFARYSANNSLMGKLNKASKMDGSNFYAGVQKSHISFLKIKLQPLITCCSDGTLARELKEEFVRLLNTLLPFLPEQLEIEFNESLSKCSHALKEEKEKVIKELEESKQADDLEKTISIFKEAVDNWRHGDCYLAQTHIQKMIKKTIVRFREYLKTDKCHILLQSLPKVWKDWSDYLSICNDLHYYWWERVTLRGYRGYLNSVKAFKFCYDGSDTKADIEHFLHQVTTAITADFSLALSVSKELLFEKLVAKLEVYLKLNEIRHSEDKSSRHLFNSLAFDYRKLEAFFKLSVSTFVDHYAILESLVSQGELNPAELKEALDIFSTSDALYQKLNAFCSNEKFTSSLDQASSKLIKQFQTCSPYSKAKDVLVEKMFLTLCNNVKRNAFLHTETLKSPNAQDRDAFYREMFRCYDNISRSAILKAYVNVKVVNLETLEAECDQHLIDELDKISNFLIHDIIGSPCLSEEDYADFSVWYDNLRSFKDAFGNSTLAQYAASNQRNVKKKFQEMVQGIVNEAGSEVDNNLLVPLLFSLKAISKNIAVMKSYVDEAIDKILTELKDDEHGPQRIINIGILLNASSDPMALMIVADHKAFEGSQLYLFNTKVARFTVENVLDERDGIKGTDLDRNVLLDQFNKFDKEYQSVVSVGLLKSKEACISCVSTAKTMLKDTSLPRVDRLRRALVQMFAFWTLSNTEHYFDAVNSSEGKDEKSAESLDEPAVGSIDEQGRKYLKQPHAGQIISIFRLLGFDFCKAHNIPNHFVQVSTGEGKSLIMAMSACIFALQGNSVDCACYSEYLSRRDYDSFSSMFHAFGVHEFIFYNTFTQLCERQLNNFAGDIREGVEAIIQTPPDRMWNKGAAVIPPHQQRKKILLIDEVDVFFSSDFYGSAYRPLANIEGEEVASLLDAVWENRKLPGLRLGMVKKWPEYFACVSRFSKWEHLLEESVKSMIGDLKSFETYEVTIQGDRIGYKDQDKISFDISYGYQTTFAYYKANLEGRISEASLRAKKHLVVDCGSYSFAEIPKLYNHVLGVTGTLETLSKSQKSIIQDKYHVSASTVIPSVYGKNKLQYAPDSPEDNKIDSDISHFSAITNEITDRRKTPGIFRPVLVFFETTAELNKYYNSKAALLYRSKMMVVTEEVTAANKNNIIRQATSPGSITILSKEFGRGTDFIIYDERVNEIGGVHVIQTFLSEELSEETQIKGRSARQGCKGSYCMILSDLHLERFGINKQGPDSVQYMKSNNKYYEILNRKRCAYFEDKYKSSLEYEAHIEKDHRKAMEFLGNLKFIPPARGGDDVGVRVEVVEDISMFLAERNKSYHTEAVSTSRTLILMDATGSMARLLTKAKNTVKTMISEANAILDQQGIASSFEVQFAVYRNYNAPKELILEHSGWEQNPDNLFQFMDTITAQYGLGREAIEVGFWHANKEFVSSIEDQLFQVILIGDQPANVITDMQPKRARMGQTYWNASPFGNLYYETELEFLRQGGVPVHSFYVHENAAKCFNSISRNAGPDSTCRFLDIDTAAGAETLTGLVTERILNDVGGRGDAGQALIDEYRQRFPKGYTKSNAAAACN